MNLARQKHSYCPAIGILYNLNPYDPGFVGPFKSKRETQYPHLKNYDIPVRLSYQYQLSGKLKTSLKDICGFTFGTLALCRLLNV